MRISATSAHAPVFDAPASLASVVRHGQGPRALATNRPFAATVRQQAPRQLAGRELRARGAAVPVENADDADARRRGFETLARFERAVLASRVPEALPLREAEVDPDDAPVDA